MKNRYNYKIKSEFIKNLIKKCSFSNEDAVSRIDDLILLEAHILTGKTHSCAHPIVIFYTIERRRSDYERLLQELNSKKYKEYMKKKIKERKEQKETDKEIKKEEDILQKKERHWWIKNEGRP